MRKAVVTGIGWALAVAAAASAADRQTLAIPRVDEPPVLERYLDGTTRPPGVEVTDFRQREPGEKTARTQNRSTT